MKFSESQAGRAFIIRLEAGDILHEAIERFAANRARIKTKFGVHGATELISADY
jgi:predicted DNA-binding protein with PD1-like motif